MSENRKFTARSHWLLACLLGLAFECALIAELISQFQQAWFFIELYNLALVSHYLFFLPGEFIERGPVIVGIVWLIFYELIMVLLWSLVFSWIIRLSKWALSRPGVSKRKKLLVALSIAIATGGALVWQVANCYFDRATPFAASASAQSVVAGNNTFALDLYQLLKNQQDNLFFSPNSISAGMGLVYAGARGNTEREIAQMMHFGIPHSELHAAFGELDGRMKNVQHWHHLALLEANSLWFQKDCPFTTVFMNLVRSNYHAEAHPVDFKRSPMAAGHDMADWIEKSTGGRMRQAINPKLLTPDTRLALCNAIYFKGEWASEFKRSQTKPAPFHITTNETVSVPTMCQKADFKVLHDSDMQMSALEMPYYGRDLSMIILLPDDTEGLAGLEQQLNLTNVESWLAALGRQSLEQTWVVMPRFTFTRNIDLAEQMKLMGVRSLFDSTANLSGMEASTNLYVSDFLHQAFVEVNEHGTEATAMTIELAKSKGMTDRFIMDHPFIFLIRDNATGSILFLGRMTNPEKQ